MSVTPPTTRVWDPLQRLLHASLVVAVVLGWITTAWFSDWHEAVGDAALGVVAMRVLWGRVGPARARFASFVRGLRATCRHAAGLLRGKAPRHRGDNPLGDRTAPRREPGAAR